MTRIVARKKLHDWPLFAHQTNKLSLGKRSSRMFWRVVINVVSSVQLVQPDLKISDGAGSNL
jgi:hypothetical protein